MTRISPAWTARLSALLAGLAAGLAHPPFGLLLGLLGYGLMMRLSETEGPRPLRAAFFRGWLSGVGYFAISVWWITEAFLVDAATYGWMAPFALLFLSGGLALFWGLAALLYRLSRPRGLWRVLVFAGCLALLEWVRGRIFSGFPWNLPGETWRAGSAPSQAAALVGSYGLTWITVALAAAPALLFDAAPRRARAGALGAAVVVLAGLYVGGGIRLSQPAAPNGAPRVRLVQANIDQKEKWRPENLALIFDTYLRLSQKPGPTPAVIVWPEGALPAVVDDLLQPGSPYVNRLTEALAPGQTLLMGANRAAVGSKGTVDYFNSLVALRRAPGGLQVTGVYDKHHLVPFGEYVPLGDLAGKIGLRSLVHMPEDFTAGPEPQPLRPAGVPAFQPLICYEALFPELARGAIRPGPGRPAWILNISNDAWFGATSGPWQHLNLASYRAIEAGLPIARATPTGVTAMIDAYGRSPRQHQLGQGQLGVVDAILPPSLPPTLYARWGEGPFAMMLLISGLIVLAGRMIRRG